MVRATTQEAGAVMARLGDPKGPNKSGWAIFYQQSPYVGSNSYGRGHIVFDLANDSALSRPEPKPASMQENKKKEKKKDPLEDFRIPPNPPFNPMKRAIQVKTRGTLPSEEWVHLFVTYDGSGKAEGVRLYLNGVLQGERTVTAPGLRNSIGTKGPFKVAQRSTSGSVLHCRSRTALCRASLTDSGVSPPPSAA